MAKKQPAKKQPAKKPVESQEEQIVLGPNPKKALRLIDKSAKVREELEEAAMLAAAKAVRTLMKKHDISLTPLEASVLAAILFGE
ncbi:MAG: hypothetical protein LLG00_15890 [Planctomycetaceae bacterium]|nr:hypothetical protein [Planctomycetaceae bacterium]